MPNNVINEIIFKNVNNDIQENILKKVLKNGFVSFDVLLPPPLNIWRGNRGLEEGNAFGKKNWYDWNTENWGTKWNAYGQDEKSIARTEDTLTLTFQTAWSPPRLWLCALFNATEMPFEHNWLSEGDIDAYTAKFFFSGEGIYYSPDWKEQKSEKKMYYHLHILLWGHEPESNKSQIVFPISEVLGKSQ
jgi:hypothetical protein